MIEICKITYPSTAKKEAELTAIEIASKRISENMKSRPRPKGSREKSMN